MRVNFLVVGGIKCATTSIHNYLNQHPELCLAEGKETHYFLDREPLRMGSTIGLPPIAKTLSEYHDRFLNPDRLCGEVCPSYLQFNDQKVANKIWCCNSQMKIIAILRDPIDRLLSAYRHLKTYNRITTDLSIEDLIYNESKFIDYHPIYKLKSSSLYSNPIACYKFWFGDRVKIYQYEQFIQYPQVILSNIFNFLGVENISINTSFQWNANLNKLPDLTANVRLELEKVFKPDIQVLIKANLIDPNLWTTYRY